MNLKNYSPETIDNAKFFKNCTVSNETKTFVRNMSETSNARQLPTRQMKMR